MRAAVFLVLNFALTGLWACGSSSPPASDENSGSHAGAASHAGGAAGATAGAGASGAAASSSGSGGAPLGGSGGAIGTAGSAGSSGASTGGGGSAGASAGGTGGVAAGSAGIGGGAGTGGVGGSNAGGSGGSGGYQPCPSDASPCKVLPLGDSITWGVGDEANGGYRGPLFALASAAKQRLTFTGSLSNGPTMVSGQPFPMRNEGHKGWTISMPNASTGGSGISGLIPSPAFSSSSGGSPNVILMMIGTNDVGNMSGAQMTTQLGSLLDKIITNAPDATLIVAKITPVSWASSVVKQYNDAIPGLVQARTAAGKHVLLADMNTGFDSATMFSTDNLHPNGAGYHFMATRWYAVLGPLLRL